MLQLINLVFYLSVLVFFYQDSSGYIFFINCCLVSLIHPITIIIHELGHFILGTLSNMNVHYITIGSGKVLHKFQIKELTIQLNRSLHRGGLTYHKNTNLQNITARYSLFLLGGVCMNFLIIFVLLVFSHWDINSLYQMNDSITLINIIILSNLLCILCSLAPITYSHNSQESDGLQLVKLLFIQKRKDNLINNTRMNIGLEHLQNQEFGLAEKIFGELSNKAETHIYATLNLSICLIRKLKFQETIQILINLHKKHNVIPSGDNYYEAIWSNNLAWAYLLLDTDNSISKAEAIIERITCLTYFLIDEDDIPNDLASCIHGTTSAIYLKLGHHKEAIELLEQSILLKDPKDCKFNFELLSIAYLLLNKKDKAQEYQDKANFLENNIQPDESLLLQQIKTICANREN